MPALLVISACDGLGSGSAPQGLKLLSDQGEGAAYISECSLFNLVAEIYYAGENGLSGDFSERVNWYSDNPGIATVSNADVPVEGSLGREFYRRGVVLARAPGATTIRAEYLDFRASMVVEVAPLETLDLLPAIDTLAAGTQQKFVLLGKVAGSPEALDLTEQVSWSLEGNPTNMHLDDEQANVLVLGAENDRMGTLVARIPECGYRAERALKVSEAETLSLEYQFEQQSQLPVSYSESMQVIAQFSDGSTHNLTSQSLIEFEDEDVLQIQLLLSSQPGEERFLVQALQVSPDIGFQLTVPGREPTVLASKRWIFEESDLLAVRPEPAQGLQLDYPDVGQLSVMGQFSNGVEIDITRHMGWGLKEEPNSSLIDASLITVGNQLATAGAVIGANLRANFTVQAVPPAASGLDALQFPVKLYPSYQ